MLRHAAFTVVLTITGLVAAPASAGNGKSKKATAPKTHLAAGCPPGLAKKNPSCVPPGLAKKRAPNYAPRYSTGDLILRDYSIIRDAGRYGLRQGDLYYLVGREVFRISPETGRVLAFIGLADALLN